MTGDSQLQSLRSITGESVSDVTKYGWRQSVADITKYDWRQSVADVTKYYWRQLFAVITTKYYWRQSFAVITKYDWRQSFAIITKCYWRGLCVVIITDNFIAESNIEPLCVWLFFLYFDFIYWHGDKYYRMSVCFITGVLSNTVTVPQLCATRVSACHG